MLVRDRFGWVLPADPRAVGRISRFSRIVGIACAIIGGWALLCGLGFLLFGGLILDAVSTADQGNTAIVRWGIGGGITVSGVVFAIVAVVILNRLRTLRKAPQQSVLTVDARGVSVVGMGSADYADLISIHARIGPRPIYWSTTMAKTAGNELAATLTGRSRIMHELVIRRRSGPDIRADLSMHTSPASFTQLVDQLRGLLAPYSIPVEFRR
ncbi:hypothetical protein [Brevibacterium sp. FAM 24638]|uniref:hypothetical protein n=1 Tax=Brevibacterium sp. FAM 24638 TaxID=3415681 RepID=UPI003C7C48E8